MLRSVAAWSVENRVGGDYVLAIKDDHPTLHKAMSETRYYLSSLPVNCLAAIIEDAVALGVCRPILNANLPIWVKAIFDRFFSFFFDGALPLVYDSRLLAIDCLSFLKDALSDGSHQ